MSRAIKAAVRRALSPILVASALQAGCATPARERCGLVACGVQGADLLQVTAEQLGATPGAIQLYDIRNYPGATVAWRVRHAGRAYQCREARDPAAPSHVRFVYCRPAT